MAIVQFTPEQIDRIRGARRVLGEMIRDFENAEACGVDCEALVRMREASDSFLAEVESRFIEPQMLRQANAGQ